MKTKIQQGDILLLKVNIDITSATKLSKDKRGIVLAEGETTGHYHAIEVDENEAELIRIGEKMLLNVKSDYATLKHQEHKPIDIPKGVWEVGRVQEYDYFSQMKRPVVD